MEIHVTPHNLTTISFGCRLNPELLGDWNELSEQAREVWEKMSSSAIPCEGEGYTGAHCCDCRYVTQLEVVED